MSFDGKHSDEIAAFLAVGREGSMTGAGRMLAKDPTIISRRVSAMEKRLGVRLLERSTRQLQLTDGGARLFEQLVQAETLIADAQAQASDQAKALRGKIKVALPAAMGRMWLAPMFARFMHEYPGLDVEVRLDERYVDLIADGFDVAVRVGVLEDSRLVVKKVGKHLRVLGASPSYLRARGVPLAPEDLGAHNCLELMTLASYPYWRLHDGESLAVVKAQGTLRSEDSIVLLEAARAGLGIMGAGEWLMSRDFAAGSLVRILPAWSFDAAGGIYLVRPSTKHAPARSQTLIDWLSNEFADGMPWERFPG